MAETRRPLRRLFVGALLLVAAFGFVLGTEPVWDETCGVLRRRLPGLTGYEVGIQRCELDPLTQTIRLRGVSASRPGEATPLFLAESVEVALRGVGLGGVRLGHLKVWRPRLNLTVRPPPPGRAGPKSSGCAFDGLEHLRIDQLDIRGARVGVEWPDGRRFELSSLDVGWSERRGNLEFRVDGRDGLVRWDAAREFPLDRVWAEGHMEPDGDDFELVRAEADVDDASLTLSGTLSSLCNPEVSLEAQLFAPLSQLTRAARAPEAQVDGHVWTKVFVSGTPAAPRGQLDFAGSGLRYGALKPGDLRGHFSYDGKTLSVDSLEAKAGAGSLKLSGNVQLEGRFPVKVELRTQEAQFARVLEKVGLPGAWVDFPASLRTQLSGQLWPFQLKGDAELNAGRFVVATRAFDAPEEDGTTVLTFPSGRALFSVGLSREGAHLGNVRAETGGSKYTGDVMLYFDEKRGLDIHGRSDAVDLADYGHIAELPWEGKGKVEAHIVGPYGDVAIDGQADLQDFVLWGFSLGSLRTKVTFADDVLGFADVSGVKGRSPYDGTAELRFQDDLYARARLQLRPGRAEDVVDLLAKVTPAVELLQGGVQGQAQGSVDIDSKVSKLQGTVSLSLQNLRYYGRRLGDGEARFRFEEGRRLVLEPTTLTGALGTTRLDGTYAFDGPLDFRFRVEPLSLAELVGEEQARRIGLEGTLLAVGQVEGDTTLPIVTGYLTSPRVMLAGRSLGAMHLEAKLQGREAQVWGKPVADSAINLKTQLKSPYPFEGTLSLSLPNLAPFLPDDAAREGLTGSLAGTVAAKGAWLALRSSTAQVDLSKLTLSRGDFTGRNEGPVSIHLEDGRFTLNALQFRGPNTELNARGFWGPQTVDLEAQGRFDVRLVESFLAPLERTSGRVELSVNVSGPVQNPRVVGSAELREGRFSVRGQYAEARAVSGRVDFSESRALVRDVHGVLNDGRLSVRGDVRLRNLRPARLELSMDLEDVHLRPLDELPLVTTGTLLLHGEPDALQLGGGLDVVRMRYDRPVVLDAFVQDLTRPRVGGGASKATEWLRYDVDLDLTGDLRVENNLARARLGGKLKLVGTNLRPGLVGTVEALEGGQAFFRGNEFSVQKGQVQFLARSGFDGVVDVSAQTQVREYLVYLKAFGRMSDPKVLLSSEPPLSEGDILTLLTLGVTSRDAAVGSEGTLGVAAEALLSASGLDRQVQRFLPKSGFIRDLQVHMSTTYNEVSGVVEPTWNLESKLLTGQLKLGMSQPVSGRGTRAQAEYRFNDRFSARAQWDNELQNSSFGNPGLDLRLRFDVD